MWKPCAERPQASVSLRPSRGPGSLTRWLGLEASTRALKHARASSRACVAPNARIRAVESGRGSRRFRESRGLIRRLQVVWRLQECSDQGRRRALAPAARTPPLHARRTWRRGRSLLPPATRRQLCSQHRASPSVLQQDDKPCRGVPGCGSGLRHQRLSVVQRWASQLAAQATARCCGHVHADLPALCSGLLPAACVGAMCGCMPAVAATAAGCQLPRRLLPGMCRTPGTAAWRSCPTSCSSSSVFAGPSLSWTVRVSRHLQTWLSECRQGGAPVGAQRRLQAVFLVLLPFGLTR